MNVRSRKKMSSYPITNFSRKVTKELLYELYIEKNLLTIEIAEMYCCSKTIVERKLRKFDLKKKR